MQEDVNFKNLVMQINETENLIDAYKKTIKNLRAQEEEILQKYANDVKNKNKE